MNTPYQYLLLPVSCVTPNSAPSLPGQLKPRVKNVSQHHRSGEAHEGAAHVENSLCEGGTSSRLRGTPRDAHHVTHTT